ncbi:hypothetical protein SAMN06297280_3043 [Arsukibacterium tuosuense]|uniref:Uncharacterized protein n=1 Tax=Arsukibacterium tuosuense TaxID=1323745 RepID=A0A285J845_9GAMM|nr:hypothetical protein [Arsukibacterium tuosuense]SNY56027.1 hypothetical protein SAMN06297280_3043 [Arsukibacterium tuosuense]
MSDQTKFTEQRHALGFIEAMPKPSEAQLQIHFSRVFSKNFMIGKNIDNYIRYAEAITALGFGRELIAYVTPE